MRSSLSQALGALISLCPPFLAAHPIPDIPVRGNFDGDGNVTIRVEVDPRCFEADWELENYLFKIQMDKLMSPADCDALKVKAMQFVERGVEFFFEPQGSFKPEFSWEFTTLGGGPAVNIDDPIMVTGTWTGKVPAGLKGYAVAATKAITFSVVFENVLRGKPVERTAVLFPGEKSFALAMDGSNASANSAPPEISADTAEGKEAPGASTRTTSAYTPWLRTGLAMLGALAALWLASRSRA